MTTKLGNRWHVMYPTCRIAGFYIDLVELFNSHSHGWRPGAEFGGRTEKFRRPNFRITFFRNKFPFL